MRVGVVIANYYAERQKNVAAIVEALQGQTRPPDSILLWNNGPGLARPVGAQIIECPVNLGCAGRYIAAAGMDCDWVLFQDNDLVLGPTAVERAEAWMGEPALYGPFGVRFVPDRPYASSVTVRPTGPAREPVDMVLGRISFMPHSLAVSVAEQPGAELFRCDDIVAASIARPDVWAVEIPYDEFPEDGVGLSWDRGHYTERDASKRRWFPW